MVKDYKKCIKKHDSFLNEENVCKVLDDFIRGNDNKFISFVCFTDKVDFEWFNLNTFSVSSLKDIFEFRIFNQNTEFHAVRSALNKDFSYRIIEDEGLEEEYFFDEDQYLDIDEVRTKKKEDGYFYSIGGGKYFLPVDKAKKIKLRNYIEYDENGMAAIIDFRIVELLASEQERRL